MLVADLPKDESNDGANANQTEAIAFRVATVGIDGEQAAFVESTAVIAKMNPFIMKRLGLVGGDLPTCSLDVPGRWEGLE